MKPTAFVAVFILALSVQHASGQVLQQPAVPNVRIDQKLDELVPLDVTLRDEKGRARALKDFFTDKPVVLVLAYYRCPRLCSLVLSGVVDSLRRVRYEIGVDFDIVTVSIDPRETPELAAAKKEAYVAQYGRTGAETAWHFLTGDAADIQRLADAVGFRYVYDTEKDEYVHASGFMVLTAEGKISRYFFGITYPPTDLNYALEDASAGKIGSPLTQPLRLLCYTYDPSSGRYTLAVLRLVQIAGVLTVLGGGTAIGLAWLREKRRHKLESTAR